MHRRLLRRSPLIPCSSGRIRLTLAIGLAVLWIVASLAGDQEAIAGKGGVVQIEPVVGHVGTTVEVSSRSWPANTAVEISAGFSVDQSAAYSENLEFAGPVAASLSDEDGAWSVEVNLNDIGGLELEADPGFVFFRATSEDFPAYFDTTNIIEFALEVDGRRPSGAGEIRTTISVEAGAVRQEPTGWVGWRRPGASQFTVWRGSVRLPNEVTIDRLADGEWEVAFVPPYGFSVVDDGEIEIVDARICHLPYCEIPKKPIVMKKVQIDASAESIFFTVREDFEPAIPRSSVDTGTDGGGASDLLILWILLGVAATAAFLALAYRTWRRTNLRAVE